jgi:hypothetical protein
VAGDEFGRAAADLVWRLRRWSPASWSVSVSAGRCTPARTRAEAVHQTVQRLADFAATAEGRPLRPVPRLEDRVLPDQLAVMAHDVRGLGDAAAEQAALAEVAALRELLGLRG